MSQNKQQNRLGFFSTCSFLSQFINNNKLEYILFYIGWLIQNVVVIITPLIFGIMINQIVYYHNLSVFIQVGIVFFLITVFGIILYYLLYEMYADLWNAVNRQFRLKLFKHMQNLSFDEYVKIKRGETVNMIQFWSNEGVNFIIRNIVHFINNIVLVVICLGIILYINWIFGLITTLLLPVTVIISKSFGKKIRKNSNKNKKIYEKYFNWLFEVVHSIPEIRLLGAENEMMIKLQETQDSINNNNSRIALDNQIAKEGLSFFQLIVMLIQYSLLGFFAIKNGLNIGIITALLSFYALVSKNILEIVDKCLEAQRRISIIQSMKDFLNKETFHTSDDKKIKINDIEKIEMRDVCFTYDNKSILNHISFSIKKNQTVAIVGNSGSGKSTIINLLLCFLKPISGDIKINDISLNDIDIDSYYKKISIVFQNVLLMKDSIKNNITMDFDYSIEEIEKAIFFAGLEKEIDTFENNYDYQVIGDAVNLSGGQKQRIGIARALIKKSNLLIMDEATSALDSENEQKIIENIIKQNFNRINIIVSHRYDVIMKCDFIVMIKDGYIHKIGRPNDMLEDSYFKILFNVKDC